MTPRLLADKLRNEPFCGYTYSYPHKTSYRRLPGPVNLKDVWAKENKESLFLYLHIPFCRSRCSYCNLFSLSDTSNGLTSAYITTMRRQAEQVRDAIEPDTFARMAIGGGTPTSLDAAELEAMLSITTDVLGIDIHRTTASLETAPGTLTKAKLEILRDFRIDRLSLGIQSFLSEESSYLGRTQQYQSILSTLDTIRDSGPFNLNIDLIYGMPGQTTGDFLSSLKIAMQYNPEEIYIYPLYIRPMTGLAGTDTDQQDNRLSIYRVARDFLVDTGYVQSSMRRFELHGKQPADEPEYSCQQDGMIGLGCGPRSYTRQLHYSDEYAVREQKIRDLLNRYTQRENESFQVADYGIYLDREDQCRRYVLKSLLQKAGLNIDEYKQYFGSSVFEDLPDISMLQQCDLARMEKYRLILTEAGVELSDAIGPWLYSKRVLDRMETYRWQ